MSDKKTELLFEKAKRAVRQPRARSHGAQKKTWVVQTGKERAVSKRPGLYAGDPPQYDDDPAEYAEFFTLAEARRIAKKFPRSRVVSADEWLYGE